MIEGTALGRQIRVGVVGIGFGADVHVPAFRRDGRCKVVSIAASSVERAQAAAAKAGIEHAYGDWRDMVDHAALDVVSIAVPPGLQPVVAAAAIARGAHVFLEKPVADSLPAAEALYRSAAAARIAHAVDFMFPEIPAWAEAKRRLEAGAVGRVRHVVMQWRVETYAHRTKSTSWKLRPEAGGGTLNNFVSHALYNTEWLLGSIRGLRGRVLGIGGVEDVLVEAWFDMTAGFPVTLSVATDAIGGSGYRVEIYGEAGSLHLVNDSAAYASGYRLERRGRAAADRATIDCPTLADDRVDGVAPIVGRFLDVIERGGTVVPNLSDGVRVQRLLDAIRTSSRTGASIRVDPASPPS